MLLADHLPDPHEQVFEHRPLARGEVEKVRSDARPSRHGIDAEAAETQLGALYRLAATDERAHTRFQLGEREGFGDVVIGSEVEAAHAVRLGVVGGQDQNAAGVVVAAQLTQHLEPVDARKTDVEHDKVIVFFRAGPQRELARFRVIHGVARLSQRSYEPVRQRIVVFDYQNSHDKWLNWFEVQDSTRTGSGFLSWAHGRPGKKVRGSASCAPTPQRRKETTRETVRRQACNKLMLDLQDADATTRFPRPLNCLSVTADEPLDQAPGRGATLQQKPDKIKR